MQTSCFGRSDRRWLTPWQLHAQDGSSLFTNAAPRQLRNVMPALSDRLHYSLGSNAVGEKDRRAEHGFLMQSVLTPLQVSELSTNSAVGCGRRTSRIYRLLRRWFSPRACVRHRVSVLDSALHADRSTVLENGAADSWRRQASFNGCEGVFCSDDCIPFRFLTATCLFTELLKGVPRFPCLVTFASKESARVLNRKQS